MTETNSNRILTLDRNPHNVKLLTHFLQQQGYQVTSVISLEEVAQALSETSKINLALIDISGFDERIWSVCQQLRKQEVPFLVISPRHHAALQQASITHGAFGLLRKPLIMREFSRLIRELLKGSE